MDRIRAIRVTELGSSDMVDLEPIVRKYVALQDMGDYLWVVDDLAHIISIKRETTDSVRINFEGGSIVVDAWQIVQVYTQPRGSYRTDAGRWWTPR